jgi:hypothetical protein
VIDRRSPDQPRDAIAASIGPMVTIHSRTPGPPVPPQRRIGDPIGAYELVGVGAGRSVGATIAQGRLWPDFERVQVEDVLDVEVLHVVLLGELVEGASVPAPNTSGELVDLRPPVLVEQVLGEGFDDDLVHGLLRVLRGRLENHVELLGETDRELVGIRGSHSDITTSTRPRPEYPRSRAPNIVAASRQNAGVAPAVGVMVCGRLDPCGILSTTSWV